MKYINPFLVLSLANLAPSPPKKGGGGGWQGGMGEDEGARGYFLAIKPNITSLT